MKSMLWWCQSHYASYDAIICDGSVRSGKTFSSSIGFLLWASTVFQNQTFAFCGQTIQAVWRNVLNPLRRYFTPICGWKEKRSENYIDITFRGNCNRFYIFGGNNEGSAGYIQGMTLAGVYFDEVVLMSESFVNQALARCSVTGSKFWFNCNPGSPSHWFYRDWILKVHEKRALYLLFHLDDNPSLSPEIVARTESLYTGSFYRRFILGEWCALQGQVYTMFSEEQHVVQEIPTCSRYVVSIDYGTHNPCSFGLWGYDPKRDVWTRIREYYYDSRRIGVCRTDEEHYSALETFIAGLPIEEIVIDPSASGFITCIRRHGKYRIQRADNDVLSGIQAVYQALSDGKIQFHCSCRDLRREMQLYSWKVGEDVPEKKSDHAMDDMRYFVQTYLRHQHHRNGSGGFFCMSLPR